MKLEWMACLVIALMAACGGGGQSTAAEEPGTDTNSAAAAPACPTSVTEAGAAQGGACIEEAVLGAEVAKACTDWFASQGWVRDANAEAAIGGQTGKSLACYHAPDAQHP